MIRDFHNAPAHPAVGASVAIAEHPSAPQERPVDVLPFLLLSAVLIVAAVIGFVLKVAIAIERAQGGSDADPS